MGRCELMDDKMVKIINDANGFEVRRSSVTHTRLSQRVTHTARPCGWPALPSAPHRQHGS